MAWGVDEIEHVLLPISGGVKHADGRGFDGDAPLSLDVHGIEELGLHIPLGHSIGELHHSIRQGGFAVIDVSDDAKVANMRLVHTKYLPEKGIEYHTLSHAKKQAKGALPFGSAPRWFILRSRPRPRRRPLPRSRRAYDASSWAWPPLPARRPRSNPHRHRIRPRHRRPPASA